MNASLAIDDAQGFGQTRPLFQPIEFREYAPSGTMFRGLRERGEPLPRSDIKDQVSAGPKAAVERPALENSAEDTLEPVKARPGRPSINTAGTRVMDALRRLAREKPGAGMSVEDLMRASRSTRTSVWRVTSVERRTGKIQVRLLVRKGAGSSRIAEYRATQDVPWPAPGEGFGCPESGAKSPE